MFIPTSVRLGKFSGDLVRFTLVPFAVIAVALAAGAPGHASPAAHPRDVCQLFADKSAYPTVVGVNEPVEITLTLNGSCPQGTGGTGKADIVMAIDHSASQHDNNTWQPTVQAARAFVDLIDFNRHQVAILTFSGNLLPFFEPETVMQIPLSPDGDKVKAALAAIPDAKMYTMPTNLTAAVDASQRELTSARHRTDAQPVIVLLSDGDHNSPTAGSPIDAASAAKSAGTTILTIGLGATETAANLLRQMASRPELYFPAPTSADVERAYRDAAGQVSGGTGRIAELKIVDVLPSEVQYVPGSAAPVPDSVQGSTLTWSVPALSAAGWVARFTVRPLVEGTYSPNKLAYVDYLDADGNAASRVFPLPIITVRRKAELRIFLPILQRNFCKSGRPFDVVLAVDTSDSMQGEKLVKTRAAAREFLQFLDIPPSTAAVVAFNKQATVVQGLTSDRAAALAALDNLPSATGTRIDLALKEGARLLGDSGRDKTHAPVIILLTDGRQDGTAEQDALNAAAAVRRTGATVYTIGIGPDVAMDFLIRIAGDPARFYSAPGSDALRDIYQAIAGELPCRWGQ